MKKNKLNTDNKIFENVPSMQRVIEQNKYSLIYSDNIVWGISSLIFSGIFKIKGTFLSIAVDLALERNTYDFTFSCEKARIALCMLGNFFMSFFDRLLTFFKINF